MHKDINPSNIVLNPATGQVKLIDFGISTVLSRETPAFRNANVLEGTLAYISPEQTGRMNRDLDYRTDFYSFGVTLYELLTGLLPFPSTDALELVHSHIARLPPPPHVIRSDLPLAVSAIVLKLLAKNAEDRYQSAYGIVADLAECLRQWRASGSIAPFLLGRHDSSDKFQIPQKLYGREQEVGSLLAAFDRVSRGAGELLLVSGYSGVGKSALVHEIYRPMTERRGYFIAGKFDQFQRNIPLLGADPGVSLAGAAAPDRGRGRDRRLARGSGGGARPERPGDRRCDPRGRADTRAAAGPGGAGRGRGAAPLQAGLSKLYQGVYAARACAGDLPRRPPVGRWRVAPAVRVADGGGRSRLPAGAWRLPRQRGRRQPPADP